MKILLLAQGQATHTQRFINLLLHAGHSVVEVDPFNPFPYRQGNYSFFPYPFFSLTSRIRTKRLRRFINSIIIPLKLRAIWQKIQPDVTHILSIGDSAYYCALAGIKPLVLTAWGSDINNLFPLSEQPSYYLKQISRALVYADYVTGDTQLLLDRAKEIAGKKLNVSLFYFGIDLELFKSQSKNDIFTMKQEIGIPGTSKVVLSMRKFSKNMKQHLILQSFASAINENNIDAVLIFRRIFIRSDNYEKEIRDLASQWGILDRIYWVDQMDYELLPSLYHMADVVVNFPENDGFPVTLLEAAASRVPIITSDLEAYREILSSGGFFRVPSGNVAELARNLKRILCDEFQDQDERLHMNYELITRIADQEKSLADIEKIYGLAINNQQVA